MSKPKDNQDKPAFPARTNAMGYSDGLSKLELITALLVQGMYASNTTVDVSNAVSIALEILQQTKEKK